MSALTPADARASVLEAVSRLQAVSILGLTEQQQETAARIASRLHAVAGLITSMDDDLARLQRIEAAALRVASSRRDGIVTDKAVLDVLDKALEAQS